MFSYLHYSKIMGAFRAFSPKTTARGIYITLVLGLAWIPMQQNQANVSDYRVEVWPGSCLPPLSFSRYPM